MVQADWVIVSKKIEIALYTSIIVFNLDKKKVYIVVAFFFSVSFKKMEKKFNGLNVKPYFSEIKWNIIFKSIRL